jgi:hypothetical protein
MSESGITVKCYSGHTYAQEPRSFVSLGQEHFVAAVNSVRRVLSDGKELFVFAVETNERLRFRLSYDEDADCWSAEGPLST